MSETYSLSDVRAMASEEPEVFSLAAVKAMQKGEASISDTNGRALTAGGIPAAAFKVAEAMGTPEGRAEAWRLGLGAVRGATDIGNTILGAGSWLLDKAGIPTREANHERRDSLDQFFDERIPAGNVSAGLGRLTTNIAGTLGVGPAIAAPLRAVGGPAVAGLANAVETAGMRTGAGITRAAPLGARAADMALRAGGGAITGGISAGLVDPSSAGTGALIGGSAPAVVAGMGAAGRVARDAYRSAATPRDVKLASEIAQMAGIDPQNLQAMAEARDALRQQGPSLIPGAEPTVPQILQRPGVSQLQRSVKAANPAALTGREAAQGAARMEALNRIAPVSGTVQQAADEAGTAIERFAIPAERSARERVGQLFDAIPTDQARMRLPLSEMQAARAKYLGPGTFGKGNASVDAAIDEAQAIGTRRVAPSLDYSSSDLARARPTGHGHGAAAGAVEPQAVPFDQLQKLRSSLNEAISDAQRNGRNQARAALAQMKNAIDNKVAAVASGERLPGEVFTPQAIDAWGQALNAHAAKKLQFNTGPQAALFRQGADGLPAIQGAEIPGKFFGATRAQVENAQAFRRLVADDPALMADLRRYAVTDAAGQVDQFGNLSSAKFNRWLNARSGATGEIFSEQQRAMLKAVADNLRRAALAENLGRSTGSDTAQKATSMLRLGFLDSPATNYAAAKVPGGRAVLDFIRGPVQAAKAERIGGLLAEPERVGGLLDVYIASQQPKDMGLLTLSNDPMLYRTAPLLLTGPNR